MPYESLKELLQNKLLAKMRHFLSCLFFSALLFLFSCSDQGCIEADDFGEYDTQTLEIPANNSEGACEYDPTKEITDASQGSGLKTCFISGTTVVYDENGTPQSSTKGCMGIPDLKFKNLCINQCVSNCNANIGSDSFGTPEPTWVATAPKANRGVDIKPNSLIYIRTIGNISLGSKFAFPSFYINPQDPMAQSNKNDWTPQIVDVKNGKSLNVIFSGKFIDGTIRINSQGSATTAIGDVGAGISPMTNANSDAIYNLTRRIVAYIQPHPAGYAFDSTFSDEKLGAINIPLLADPNMWVCDYSTGGDQNESNCHNRSYQNNGYPKVDDTVVNGIFPLTSQSRSPTLGSTGGMIRWNDDGLKPESYDPFSTGNVLVNCSSGNCVNANNVTSDEGNIVGDISSSDSRSIIATAPSLVSFKYLLPGITNCDGPIDLEIKTSTGTLISTKTITVNSNKWSNQLNDPLGNSQNISLEVGQQVIVKSNPAQFLGGNCGAALAVRFSKYHDITISQSGMVSFAILGGSVGGCTIKARIVNPKGSFLQDTANGIDPDFYEYEDFNLANKDPLRSVFVPPIPPVGGVWFTSAVDNGSTKAFVRKGQVIRFSPESWNASWSNINGVRRCGIGMAMRIEPRPALLCRGYDYDNIMTAGCTPKIVGSSIIGCDEIAKECSDNTSTAYCPFTKCIFPLSCQPGTGPLYARTCNPLPTGLTVPSTCDLSSSKIAEKNQCLQCSQKRLEAARKQLYTQTTNPTMAKCYNLENYRGKVSNIPFNGFSDDDLKNDAKAKGSTKLGDFEGTMGIMGSFSDLDKKDRTNDNELFQFSQPLNIAREGRLKFILLDGQDFLDMTGHYLDNTAPNAAFTGLNGIKIDISSFLEFSNGEWLEARLCRERPDLSGTNITTCRDINFSSQNNVPNQPRLVELADPVGNNYTPQSTSTYKFDPFGNLLRYRTPEANGECVNALLGDTFYCHTSGEPLSKLRITFKIKDPETPNCSTAYPAANPLPQGAIYDGVLVTNTKFRPSDCVVGGGSGSNNGITMVSTGSGTICAPNSDPSVENDCVVSGTSSPTPNGRTISSGATRECVVNTSAGKTCDPVNFPSTDSDDPRINPNGGCVKEFRCVNKYANNTGKYYVTVRVKTPGSNISNIVNDVISPVIEVMDGKKDKSTIGQAERIYKLIISDPRYQAILTMSLVVMYTFYGLGYLMGVTDAGLQDMVQKVLKISIIYLFVGPQGWEWFDKIVVKFFKDGTDYLSFLMASSFDESPSLKNALNNYDFYDKSILFGSVDKVFGIFFSATVQKKIAALLFASIFGWAYLLIIYYGIILYIYAVGNAILLYLTSQVFISILFVLGPLFFIFTLFNQTKEMFDSWLKQLIGFSLQQIFLLTTLSFFNMMMYEVLKLSLGYKVCWDEVWTINIIVRITLMSFWTIASLPPRTTTQSDVGNIGNTDGIPSFFSILFIWVVAELMQQFVTFMTDLAASISGGMEASKLGGGLKNAVNSVRGFASARMGEVWSKTGGQAVQRLDKFLFDSGEKAEQARKQKKQQNAADFKNRKALTEAGDAGLKKFKIDNAEKLSKMSQEEQVKALKDAKDKAIADKGKKMGLSEADIDRLKKDKGFKYVGENVFGAAFQAAKQLRSGGNLVKSMNDDKVTAKFSAKEAKAALKKTDSEGRKAIVDAVKKGDLHVGRSGVVGAIKSAASFKNLKEKAAGLKNSMGMGDYDEARKQLEKEGEITTMRKGSSWSRDPKEKEKIRERMQKNLKEKGENKKMSTKGTTAKLEMQAEIMDELDKGGEGKYVRADNIASAIVGRNRTVGAALQRYRRGKELKAGFNRVRGEAVASYLEKKAASAGAEYDKSIAEEGRLSGVIENLEGDKDIQSYDKSEKTLHDPKASKSDKDAAKQNMATLSADKGFKAKKAELNKNIAARNQAVTKSANLRQQKERASKGAVAAREGFRIREYAQGYISGKNTSPEKLAQAKAIAKEYDSIISGKFNESKGGTIEQLASFAGKDYEEFTTQKAQLVTDAPDMNLGDLFAEPQPESQPQPEPKNFSDTAKDKE